MKKETPDLFAAIHLGTEQVSIEVVEYSSLHDIRRIDSAIRHVSLGEETFKNGMIDFSSVSEICELLKGYRKMMAGYGVRDYRLVATTAIREAQNQHYIIDQIRVKTGFQVDVVDMPQEIYYKYCSLFRNMETHKLTHKNDGLLFVDISSGGLGIILYKERQILYQQNIHLGALRIKESFDREQREANGFHQALQEYIYSAIHPVERELRPHKIQYLILSGFETRLLLRMLGKVEQEALSFIKVDEFNKLYKKVQAMNLPQLMKEFALSEDTAEIVLPTIVLYKQILALVDAGEIIVAGDRFIDGLTLLHVAEKTRDSWMGTIHEQIEGLVCSLGRRYLHNENHALCVENFSLLFFDKLQRFHGLGKKERIMLKVAASLHDVGKFVSLRRHYFYSYRLIISSDIFGLSESEKQIVANVAYYHSKHTPQPTDDNFEILEKGQRVTVAKLAAIIRLADALDRSHRQKIRACHISIKGDEMIVKVSADEDISLEEWTFNDKAEFFQEVFGIRAILER